jgi:hypothetical protein
MIHLYLPQAFFKKRNTLLKSSSLGKTHFISHNQLQLILPSSNDFGPSLFNTLLNTMDNLPGKTQNICIGFSAEPPNTARAIGITIQFSSLQN